MQCTVKEIGRRTVIVLHGNLDSPQAAGVFRDSLASLLASGKRKITVDLSYVDSIDSNGIGKFLLFYKKLRENGGELRVSSLKGRTEEIFKTLMLDQLFGSGDQAGG